MGNEEAWDALARLSSDIRIEVMQEFDPGPNTRDICGKLCGFASSVARKGAGKSAPARTPSHAPPWSQSLWGSSQAGQPRRRHGDSVAEQFADRWQLDEGSRALLRGLTPDAQRRVI